jgi:hypothetical protein
LKKIVALIVISLFGGLFLSPAIAQDELIYVAVEPCRIVDTRKGGTAAPVKANTSRNFLVSGTPGELFNQGGSQTTGCPAPKSGQKPAAIAAYIVAVPNASSVSGGILTAYPSDISQPAKGTAATVNFDKDQTIGNTTIVTVCDENCPADGELAILARNTDEDVVIDVQGYFYPPAATSGYQIVQVADSTANNTSLTISASCPPGTKVLGGGGTPPLNDWVLAGSAPFLDGSGWQIRYQSTGSTFSTSGAVSAICATLD